MRSREFLNEVVRGRPLANPNVPDEKLPSNIKLNPFPERKGLGYSIGYGGGKALWDLSVTKVFNLYDLQTRKPVAQFRYQPRVRLFPNAIESYSTVVHPSYRGQGLASEIYKFFAVNQNKIIIADMTEPEGYWDDSEVGQTPDARRLWIRMSESMPDITVKGWVKLDPTSFFFKESEDEIIDNIMKLGGQFLQHKEDSWIVAFDVIANPRRSELQAYIKTILSKDVYFNRTSYGPDYEQGLLLMSAARFQRMTGYAPE